MNQASSSPRFTISTNHFDVGFFFLTTAMHRKLGMTHLTHHPFHFDVRFRRRRHILTISRYIVENLAIE